MGAVRATLVSLALLFVCGCQLNSFDSSLVGETTIPGTSSVAPQPLSAIPPFASFSRIDFAQNPDFQTNDVSPAEINSAKVASLDLKIVSPNDSDFGFLDDVEFYARSGDTSTLIAEKHGIAALGLRAPNPTLSLDVTGADLTPYIHDGPFSIEVKTNGRTPEHDTHLRATVNFEFRVKVF